MPTRRSTNILIPLLYAVATAIAFFALFSAHQASASVICDEFGCITVDDGKTGTIRVDTEEQKFQARETLQAQQQQKLQANQPQPLTPVVSCDLTELPCGFLKVLNWILDAVAYIPFSIAESFFGSMVNINFYAFATADNPYMAGVRVGWKIVSGVANLFFILILLWVAIATIFDFAPYTARQLLPKLIIMALLINFSLAIGSAFIRLSNGIAGVFLTAIDTKFGSIAPDGTRISGFSGGIKKIFNPEAIITTINNEYLQMSKPEAAKILQEAKVTVAHPFIPGLTVNWDAKECDDYIRGFLPGAGIVTWATSFAVRSTYHECLTFLSSLRGAHASALAAYDPDHAKLAVLSMSLVGKAVALPIGIFVLFAGGIFLLVRLIALIMVLVLGPAVFLLNALPATGQYWTQWWSALIKWSFFFPAFVFFMFISLFIYNGIGNATLITLKSNQAGVPSYGALLVNYFIGAALMIASLLIAQKMGVTFSGAVVGWGKKMGKGVGRWTRQGAGRTALRYAAPAAKRLEESRGAFARTLKAIPGVTRAAQLTAQAQRATIAKRGGDLDKYTDDELKRLVAMRGTTTNTQAAAMNLLVKRNNLREDPARIPGFDAARMRGITQTLQNVGTDIRSIERLRPDIALPQIDPTTGLMETQDQATRRAARGVRPVDIENMERGVAANVHAVQGIIDRAGSAHMQRLAERNDELTDAVATEIQAMAAGVVGLGGRPSAAAIATALRVRTPPNEGLARFVVSDLGRDIFGLDP